VKPWDIRLFEFETEGAHPAIIISGIERCENPDNAVVNALLCTRARLNRAPKRNEIILDESDGLDWKTAVRCDIMYMLRKDRFGAVRGCVSRVRQRAITRKIIECLRWPI
jgi:hypothetical protein